MKNKILLLFIFSFSIVLVSCDDGPKRTGVTSRVDPGKPAPLVVLTDAERGKIYYDTNCGGCHSAGTDDIKRAFNASDLKVSIKNDSTRITSNMSDITIYGGSDNLMQRFGAVPASRIKELKAYLELP